MENPGFLLLADQLKKLTDRKKELEQEVKQVNANIRALNNELVSFLDSTRTDSFTHDGTLFYLYKRTNANPKGGLKDDLYAALREHGYGEVIIEHVLPSHLTALVKEAREENNDEIPDWLSGLVTVNDDIIVGMRKASR